MTLPEFSADRRAAAPLLLSAGACCRRPQLAPTAVDQYLLPSGRLAANPTAAVKSVDRWHRQTDGQTLDRFIDPAPHTMVEIRVCHVLVILLFLTA